MKPYYVQRSKYASLKSSPKHLTRLLLSRSGSRTQSLSWPTVSFSTSFRLMLSDPFGFTWPPANTDVHLIVETKFTYDIERIHHRHNTGTVTSTAMRKTALRLKLMTFCWTWDWTPSSTCSSLRCNCRHNPLESPQTHPRSKPCFQLWLWQSHKETWELWKLPSTLPPARSLSQNIDHWEHYSKWYFPWIINLNVSTGLPVTTDTSQTSLIMRTMIDTTMKLF